MSNYLSKFLSINNIISLDLKLKGVIGISLLLAFLISWPSITNAQSYDGFNCESGSEVVLETPTGEGGWGDVAALTDNDAWSVWGANYPNNAIATINLNSPQTILQASIFENVFLPASKISEISFVKTNGESVTIDIDLGGSTPQNQWHNKKNINITDVIQVIFSRDNATENVAEIKLCSELSTPTFSIEDVQVTEGGLATFIVTGFGNFSYSLDYNNSTDINDFVGLTTGTGTSPTTVVIQTNDDSKIEGEENFLINLSNGAEVVASAQGVITDNDIGSGCRFDKDTNFQACLPWEVNTGVTVKVNQAMYINWRPGAVHKAKGANINEDIASYGHGINTPNNVNCFERHDRYWTLGDDGYAYHTWHPADDGICSYLHEHGDDPNPTNFVNTGDQYIDPETGVKRKSQAFEYAKGVYGSGYLPFGYAMTVYNNSRPQEERRREDHFGHKVVIANGIRMAIGNPQNIGEDIYDTGIRCDWYSKIHQGSYSADALTNNMHEYYLNLVCNDGEPVQGDHPKIYNNIDAHRSDVTKISFKTMLNWGNPYLIKENGAGGWNAYVPISNPASQRHFITVWDAVTANSQGSVTHFSTYNPIISLLQNVWGGNEPIPSLDTKPTIINDAPLDFAESGSRDFEFFSSYIWKNEWDTWTTDASSYDADKGINFPELWSGPSGNRFKTVNGGALSFAPYYIIKNPSRMLSENSVGGLELERTVDLCMSAPKRAFCSEIDDNTDWKETQFFNGTVRGLNFKAIHLNNTGTDVTSWCTDAIGETLTVVNDNGQCSSPESRILQKASAIDNGWQGYSNSERTICELNGSDHCGDAIIGTIERWSIDYQNNQWITHRKKAKYLGGSHYKGAGMGYEWIINHGNEVKVRVPN
ncbi:MAG: hypothetical protein L3J59_03385 [Methylococcaceae bacterium]|nr:hypothetical protein [Methylococcaceae bacterium]